jgi:hypothetical protein
MFPPVKSDLSLLLQNLKEQSQIFFSWCPYFSPIPTCIFVLERKKLANEGARGFCEWKGWGVNIKSLLLLTLDA